MNPTLPYEVKTLMSPKEQVLWVDKPYLWEVSPAAIQLFLTGLLWTAVGLAFTMDWVPFFKIPFKFFSIGWFLIGCYTIIVTPL